MEDLSDGERSIVAEEERRLDEVAKQLADHSRQRREESGGAVHSSEESAGEVVDEEDEDEDEDEERVEGDDHGLAAGVVEQDPRKQPLSPEQEDLLVDWWKENRCLYDKSHKNYSKKRLRVTLMQQLADRFDKECKCKRLKFDLIFLTLFDCEM
jgi:hypothetical protein